MPLDKEHGAEQLSWTLQLQQMARQQAIPLSGTFELTPRCNFNCRMCYVHLKEDRIAKFGSELSPQEWIRLAEEAREAGMISLCITGGEPLLYPGFEPFYRAVAQMGFEITLQTNASALTPRILKLLDEFPPNQAKITLYGSNDEVYQSVCGVKQGFTRVDRGIRALQELEIPIILVTTLIRQNRNDFANIEHYALQKGCPWTYTTQVYPSIRGAETDPDAILRESDFTDLQADIRRLLSACIRRPENPCQRCKSYRTGFSITWNGWLRFCTLMNEPNIPVSGQPFEQAWRELIEYEDNLRWPEECSTCDIRAVCPLCAGGIATASGSIHTVNRVYCEWLRQMVHRERTREL